MNIRLNLCDVYDRKPGNLLIAQDGTLKLADFGLAKIYGSPDRELSHEACTLWYRAPELLYGARAYGPASDIWSMGCVFAELMLRVPLFQGTSEIDQLAKIFACLGTPGDEWTGVETLPRYVEFGQWNKTPLEEIFRGAAPDALDLLKSLLVFDPLKRPTAEQVLQHPYFFNEPQPTPTASLPRPSAAS